MTLITNWYTMDNKPGVDLNNVQTSVTITSDPSTPGPRAKLGDRVQGNAGSEWVFVIASATVTGFMSVAIDQNFSCTDLTSALVASGVYSYGFAQFNTSVANTGEYFWALLKADAGVGIQVSPSATKGSILYLSQSTPGAFTSSVTSNAINGVQIVASIGTSASGPAEGIVRSYLFPALNMAVAGATV